MRRVFLSLVALLVLSAIAAGGVYVWGHAQFTRPGPLAAPVTIVIPKGKGLAAIAGRLTEAGVVANPIIFRLGARLIKADKGLQAGEYAFPVAISMREVLELLNSG